MTTASAPNPRQLRPAAFAGRFYPAHEPELRRLISTLLANVPPASAPGPKAIIAPHAGYVYSGPIAASACARLATDRDLIRRVILLGPAHYVYVEGIAASGAAAFVTPLGTVAVDTETVGLLSQRGLVTVLDEAHAPEHSLEVELPFLQTVLAEFSIVPLLVGEASAAQVARVLDAVWGGPETRVVVSSDLSHYHDSETARRLDAVTAKAIAGLEPQGVGEEAACGRLPIGGLLLAAAAHGLRGEVLDLRNSGDTAGPRDRVVGYGAFAFN